jgi:hypothetical protein
VVPVPGTPFGLALVEVRPTPSGPAIASLVAGIAGLVISLAVLCSALAWGPAVAGAFAVLTALVSVASIWLGLTGLRRLRRSVPWGAARGRGMAIAGFVCGLVGLVITAAVMLFAVAAAVG